MKRIWYMAALFFIVAGCAGKPDQIEPIFVVWVGGEQMAQGGGFGGIKVGPLVGGRVSSSAIVVDPIVVAICRRHKTRFVLRGNVAVGRCVGDTLYVPYHDSGCESYHKDWDIR
jgi:hypothetical protein